MKIGAYIENNFNKLYWGLCGIVFILIALRAFCIPFSHDEAATFFFYIQSNDYLPYQAHIYTNNHVLNSALSNLCFHLAGSHRFVLRIPNILSFIFLALGVFKHFKYLKTVFSKLVLVTFFILTINFLDFFELCRGYGLSFAFVVLGSAYLMDYFQDKKAKSFILFSLCMQLALAANLILVVLLVFLLFCVFVFQFKNKILFKPATIITQVLNILILIFWIKFSFFYKEQGKLDAGAGDNYWIVTFKSLMSFIFSTDALWMQILVIAAFVCILFCTLKSFFQSPVSINKIFTPKVFYTFTLVTLIIAFYLQKKLLDVNYPEDRTGVFFYLFFVLSLAFVIDSFSIKISGALSLALAIPSLLFFVLNYNLHDFSSYFYHTIPKSIYDKLVDEFKNEGHIITIGGHRIREMDYAFLNYRGNSVLNGMDNSEQMIMNCDYYFALKSEQPYYKYYYDEIAQDKVWNRALLKRKEKIQRNVIFKMPDTPKNFKSNSEFMEFFRLKDSVLKTRNCIEVELEITFNHVVAPYGLI